MTQFFCLVAQLVEQVTLNHRVQGSSPCGGTSFKISPPPKAYGAVFSRDPIHVEQLSSIVPHRYRSATSQRTSTPPANNVNRRGQIVNEHVNSCPLRPMYHGEKGWG